MSVNYGKFVEPGDTNVPEGSSCFVSIYQTYGKVYITWEMYAGCCLDKWSTVEGGILKQYIKVWPNDYPDPVSIHYNADLELDVFMVSVDATTDIVERYHKYQQKFRKPPSEQTILYRQRKLQYVKQDRKDLWEIAKSKQVLISKLYKLRRFCLTHKDYFLFNQIVTLLKTKKFKSEERAKLCDHIVNWLSNPNSRQIFPLTKEQCSRLTSFKRK